MREKKIIASGDRDGGRWYAVDVKRSQFFTIYVRVDGDKVSMEEVVYAINEGILPDSALHCIDMDDASLWTILKDHAQIAHCKELSIDAVTGICGEFDYRFTNVNGELCLRHAR